MYVIIVCRLSFSFSYHIFNSKYKLGCGLESQFFDKDMAVCLENSFEMTFRHRTRVVLFCNWPSERREILIIKLKGPYWFEVDMSICSCMLISHQWLKIVFISGDLFTE